MKSMKGFFIILASLMLGNLITALTKLPIPGSIFGMVILLILLLTKAVKLETVEPVANLLILIMMILFIPGTVNLMNVYDKFAGVIPQLLVITILTTLIIMAVTALVTDRIIESRKKGVD